METITIRLSEEHLERLQALAQQAKVSPEDLVQATLTEWLGKQQEDFQQAAKYVLEKNAELYRRLS